MTLNVSKGERWGRWRVLRAAVNASSYAWCQCICGTKRYVRISHLIYGKSQSCGCLIGDTHRTHGQSGTVEYHAWERMISRCHNTKHKSYKNYGGRGVRVFTRWRVSFEDFLAHVGLRPSPEHSLDRFPNHNGDYVPGNVRWATRIEQNQNTRRNVMLTFRGQTRCVSDWARVLNIGKKTISGRLERGWTVKKALTIKPVRTREYGGKTFHPGHKK